MQMLIITAVIIYAMSIYGFYELGRFERRNEALSVSIEQDDMAIDKNFEEIKRIWEA